MKNITYLEDKPDHDVIHKSFNRQRNLLLKERREEFDVDRATILNKQYVVLDFSYNTNRTYVSLMMVDEEQQSGGEVEDLSDDTDNEDDSSDNCSSPLSSGSRTPTPTPSEDAENINQSLFQLKSEASPFSTNHANCEPSEKVSDAIDLHKFNLIQRRLDLKISPRVKSLDLYENSPVQVMCIIFPRNRSLSRQHCEIDAWGSFDFHKQTITLTYNRKLKASFRKVLKFFIENKKRVTLRRQKFSANYNRLFKSINKVKPGRITTKIEALFGLIPPKVLPSFKDIEMEFMNKNLNEDQRDTVKFCVEQPYLAAIHGPPGCGKTTTLVETVLQLCIRGKKVLCTAPSNAAVDNIANSLLDSKFIPQVYLNKKERKRNKAKKTPDVVRLVAPNREISDIIRTITLNAKVRQCDDYDNLAQLELELKDYEMRLREEHAKIGGFEKDKETAMEARHRSVRNRWMMEFNRVRKLVLEQADVVVTTLAGAHDEGMLQYVSKDHFDVVVIDEASQATEPQSWLGIHNAKKVILAGDHKQLPPFVNSMLAVSGGLEESILERVSNMLNGSFVKLLSQQYRMNTRIMEWPSVQFYRAKLHCDEEVGGRVLNDLEDNGDCIFSSNPLFLIDHAGMDYPEETSNSVPKGKESKDQMSLESRYETKGDCSSIFNKNEAYLVTEYCCMLVKELGYDEDSIAIISPYAAQVKHIDQMLYGREIYDVEVRTVDSFQGREKETVLFSMTRSNQSGNIGFLSDSRRLNVAITRARRHVAVFCDTKTVCTDKIVRSLVSHCINRGHVIKVDNCNRYEMQSNISYFLSGLQIGMDQDLNNEINEISTKKSLRFDVAVEELLLNFSRNIEPHCNFINYTLSCNKLTFSPEYNRQFRHIVHYFADRMGLRHESRDVPGCHGYREIVVTRRRITTKRRSSETRRCEKKGRKHKRRS